MLQSGSLSLLILLWQAAWALPPQAGVDASAGAGEAQQRTYEYPLSAVKQALQNLGAYSGARLPMTDGFVSTPTSALDRYQRPYYQYRIEVSAAGSGRTVVKVAAKISAWYVDPQPGHSQYKSLVSNGRLEGDLLDRLQEAMEAKPAQGSPPNLAEEPAAVASGSAGRTREALPSSDADIASTPPGVTVTRGQQLAAIIAQRTAVQEKTAEIQAQLKPLEGSDRIPKINQLAAVKHSGAGVMTRSNDGGPVIFRAQAEDEFEVVKQDGEWSQVRLNGDGRGWIRTAELALPGPTKSESSLAVAREGVSSATGGAIAGTLNETDKRTDLGYEVTHEDVSRFSGDWARLKGKQVLFVYVQPRGLLTNLGIDDRKLAYAKWIFSDSYKNPDKPKDQWEGVVVIFMGGKGGVAAATVPDIREWMEGGLAEDDFMKRCSLDPPAEFQASLTRR
jgi:hypothetical protein